MRICKSIWRTFTSSGWRSTDVANITRAGVTTRNILTVSIGTAWVGRALIDVQTFSSVGFEPVSAVALAIYTFTVVDAVEI